MSESGESWTLVRHEGSVLHGLNVCMYVCPAKNSLRVVTDVMEL